MNFVSDNITIDEICSLCYLLLSLPSVIPGFVAYLINDNALNNLLASSEDTGNNMDLTLCIKEVK